MAPSPWSWYPAWAELVAVALFSLAYVLAARRLGASPTRVLSFAASQLLLLAVFVTPVGTLALEYLLAAHLFQNVAVAEWAPALAVLGVSAPMERALARRRLVRVLTRPFLALPLWLATYAVWHVPAVYDAALRDHALLLLEHATYFLAGLALWWPVFREEPWRLSSGARAAYVFAAFVLGSPLGLLLTLLPEPIYHFYEEAPRIWGVSPLTDQEIAGVIMAASEATLFFAIFVVFLLRFLQEEA